RAGRGRRRPLAAGRRARAGRRPVPGRVALLRLSPLGGRHARQGRPQGAGAERGGARGARVARRHQRRRARAGARRQAVSPTRADRDRRLLALLVAVAALLWLVAMWPVLVGTRTFFFRDLFSFFLPLRAFGARALAHGAIPALNPTWALGQAFRGDPNAAAFYPTSLLYAWLPLVWTFNFHLWAHWLLAAA